MWKLISALNGHRYGILSCLKIDINVEPYLACKLTYTEQKKKGIILVVLPFLILVENGYMGYEILLVVIFYIGLCNKFHDQSSAKGLSGQWVEFQKVRTGRLFTT